LRQSGLIIGLMTGLLAVVLSSVASGVAARGQSQGILAELDRYAVSLMREQQIPGMSYAIVKDDAVIHAKAFGVKDVATGAPVDIHTIFEIGSTTKAFTVALLAMLDDSDLIDWTDPVIEHVPDFAMQDPWVTRELQVVDLVSQRSGMPPYAIDLMSFLGFSRADIAYAVRFVEPVSSFRSTFAYVNNLFLVAADVIEAKTGLSWENNLDTRIFGSLGMTETTAHPEIVATLSNIARGHILLGNDQLWPIPDNWIYADWLDTYGPAGNIRSNVPDMSKWIRMQLGNGNFEGNQLISAENIAAMHAPRVFVSDQVLGEIGSYASGWIYNSFTPYPVVWHNGGTSGMHSIVALIPQAGIGLVVLTNTPTNSLPELMLEKSYALFFGKDHDTDAVIARSAAASTTARIAGPQSALNQAPRSRSVAAMSAQASLPLQAYLGTYTNPAYGPVEVRLDGDALQAVIGPKQLLIPLVAVGENSFSGAFPDMPEGEDEAFEATFILGESAQAASELMIDIFADVNAGRFSRIR
jgi:CubicO group peptidase (beta-lactamase class C family)